MWDLRILNILLISAVVLFGVRTVMLFWEPPVKVYSICIEDRLFAAVQSDSGISITQFMPPVECKGEQDAVRTTN